MGGFFNRFDLLETLIVFGISTFIFFIISYIFVFIKKDRVYNNLYLSLITSSIIVSSIIFAISTYLFVLKYVDYFVIGCSYLSLWINLVIFISLSVILYFIYGNKLQYNNIKTDIVPVSISSKNHITNFRKVRSKYLEIRFWLLLLLVGASAFIFINMFTPSYMLSIFIDNSISMGEEVEEGRNALLTISDKLPAHVKIVFSTFSDKTENCAVSEEEIYKAKDFLSLEAADVVVFSNVADFKGYLEGGYPECISPSTHITEAMWALFLASEPQKSDYNILLAVTDGISQFTIDNPSYKLFISSTANYGNTIYDFYDEVKLVKINTDKDSKLEDTEFFLSAAPESKIELNSLKDYTSILEDSFKKVFVKDWLLMWPFIITAIVFVFFMLLIPFTLKK